MRRAPRAAALWLTAVATMALQLPLPARAQAPTGTLKLASQTPWVGPGQELSMRVEATSAAPAASLELAVSVFRQVTSRSEFLLTLQDRIRGSALSTTAVPLNELAADPAGALTIRLPIQDPALPPDRARIRLRDEGVYPVRVELREAGGGRALDRLTTHLVYATPPTEGGLPLGFSWVLPVSAPPSLQPQGPRAVDQAASDRLALLAQRLDAHPDVPVTLQPTPETLEGLAASNREVDRNTVQTLADMAKTRQVVAGPYVPVVPGAFNGGGGESEFAAQLDRGADVLSTVLSVRADPRTWVAEDRIDEAGLERLRTQQVDRVVLPEAALAPANLSVTLTQPFDLQSRSLRRPAAAAADTELGNHFTQGDDPVLRAHVLLADLAVIYFDRPGKPRGVVAVTPRTWAPDAAFLDAVLAGLASSPIVKGVSLDDLFDDVPKATGARNSPLIRPLAANPAPASLPLAAIRAARGRLEAFATMLDADNRLTDDLEKVLLASESADLRTRQRTQYIEGVDGRVSAETGRLQVPASRTITLTARRGDIPVTVQWTGDYPVRVQVHVASDKLTFPGGSDTRIVELTRRNTTERFVVQARTSGAFPLRITLQSPDGNLVLGRARYTVRSTAASGVGIGLSIGAGAVLVLWWARNLAKGRRNRRLVPA